MKKKARGEGKGGKREEKGGRNFLHLYNEKKLKKQYQKYS